jgi:SAM-dependent methyltransferase
MKRWLDALAFPADIVTGFFQRWRAKGFRSACIFVRVVVTNFWTRQGNKRSEHDERYRRVECPCCGWRGFDFFADDTTKFWLPSVFCPGCGSHERQRMLHLYIHRHDPGLPDTEGRLLHFAAEEDVRKIFAHNKRLRYFSTEYDLEVARWRCLQGTGFLADIQNLGVAPESFDIVFCLHVLEHVRRDREAIREIRRVLKPGGVAYIMVPFDMTLGATVEWEIPDPDIHYHIWAYATSDFKDRLDVFDFQEIKPETFLTGEERTRYRIPPKEIIYRCVKREPSRSSRELAGAAGTGR